MADEIVPIQPAYVGNLALAAPMTSRAATLRAALESEGELRDLIKQYVDQHMVRGVDFGVIPGTPKPTLLKAGAEKLIDLFKVEPRCAVSNRLEDWDKGLFHYEISYELIDRSARAVLAVGLGSANSREGRYRWRKGERLCPACAQPAIIKGRDDYGGGWVCFSKKGGCGAKFGDDDAAITEQVVGRIENDDPFTLVNTILKMAKKRAQVDAAIALARCSDMFTQDVEDLEALEERQVAAASKSRAARTEQGAPANVQRQAPEPSRQQRAAEPAPARKPRAEPRPRERDDLSVPSMPYGRSQGKAIDDPRVKLEDLEWMAAQMTKQIGDPGKARFLADNRALLEALQVEILRRQGAQREIDEEPPPPPDEDNIPS